MSHPYVACIRYDTPLSPQAQIDQKTAEIEKKKLAEIEREKRALAAAQREVLRQSRLEPTEEDEDLSEEEYEYS
jgi:hypothetical protein